MRRVIALCGLLVACHAPGGGKPEAVRVETWEVKNGTPCDAVVSINTLGGQLVRKLGTVPTGTTEFFDVFSNLTKGNAVSAWPLEPDGTSLCRNNWDLVRKVVVRKLASQ